MTREVIIENINNQNVVTSRTLAEQLGKEHRHVLENIDKIRSAEMSAHPHMIETEYIHPQNNQRYRQYLLTKDGFTLYMFNIQGYNDFKLAYINRFNELERQIQHNYYIPQTYAKALELASSLAEELEKKEQLLLEQTPKVLFADSVSTSHTTILIGELAKIIKQNGYDIGQNRLFEDLRNEGYLIRRNGVDKNVPTQKAMDLGLFETKETVVNHPNGSTTIKKTPKVTGKGQIYFVNRYLSKLN